MPKLSEHWTHKDSQSAPHQDDRKYTKLLAAEGAKRTAQRRAAAAAQTQGVTKNRPLPLRKESNYVKWTPLNQVVVLK